MNGTHFIVRRALCAATSRSTTLVLVIIAVIGAVGLVALSPVALSWVPSNQQTDWNRLSLIGQTYGAASALLSVLALFGVAVSLILQTKEAKAAREQALRTLHADLLKMAPRE